MKEEKNTLKNHTKNLTEGSPVRLLLLFSLPLMAGNIFQPDLFSRMYPAVAEIKAHAEDESFRHP